MDSKYMEFRHEVLSHPVEYPELARIERAKNERRFNKLSVRE